MILRLEVEVERVSGKFVSHDDLEQALCDEVGNLSLTGLGNDGDSEYAIVSVSGYEPPKPIKATRVKVKT